MPHHNAAPRMATGLLVLLLVSLPGLAAANWLGGITFSHPSPGYLPHGEQVVVSIDCKVTEPEGVRIYVLPYSGLNPTTGYGTSGSALVPFGESTVTRYFTINSGTPTVDRVRVRMNTPDNSAQILEFFVRVRYEYGPYGIFNIQLDQVDHSVLLAGNPLNILCDYGSPGPEDVRVWARPYRDGELAGGYSASGGVLGPASGTAAQYFGFASPDVDVDQIRFYMTTPDQSEVLFEMFHPIDYSWREVGITDMAFSVPSPSMVHYTGNVTASFLCENNAGQDIRVWIETFEDGDYAPDGGWQGSTIVGPGTSALSRFFTSFNRTHVNQAHLFVRGDDGETVYIDKLIPVEYLFSPHVVTNITLDPEPPALLDNSEWLTMSYDYQTDEPTGLRVTALPFTRGEANLGYGSTGSALHAFPSGSETYGFHLFDWATEPEVDQIQFQIYNSDWSVLLEEYYVDTVHMWGSEGWVTPVPGALPSASVLLGQNYPNPFNPATTIPVELGATRHVRLAVYDLRGRLVQVVADEMMGAGRHEIPFDGSDLASGEYFFRLEGAGQGQTRSMMLVK